jgi:hypothetical protein
MPLSRCNSKFSCDAKSFWNPTETILTDGVSDAPLQSFCVVVVANALILFLVYEVEYLLGRSTDAVVSVGWWIWVRWIWVIYVVALYVACLG